MERRVAERIAAKAARSVPTFRQADPAPEDMPAELSELLEPTGTTMATADSGSTDVMDEIDQLLNYDDNESGPKKRKIPAAMESGVRASRPDENAILEAARPMSFTVYKLEDLDARARVSSPPPAPVVVPSLWPQAWASTQALAAAFLAWRKVQIARPKLGDAMAVPFATFRVDLWAALKTAPWKKIGIYGGGAVGGFLFLLFVVVTIADITDDVKPSFHVSNEVTATAAAPVAAAPAPTDDMPVAAATPPAPADAPAIEIDDQPATAAKKPAKHGAKAGKKKKSTPADIFNP